MNRRNAFAAALGVVLSGTHLARSAEIAIHVPDTAAAHSAASLIANAERAIRHYLDVCESADARDPQDIVTSDVRIEYTLDSPGAYLTFDASALFAGCSAARVSIPQWKDLWIYPTGEKNAVFIQYDMPAAAAGSTPTRQIALIEMRGERISRLRNFGAAPSALLAAMRGTAQSELCTRLSQLNGMLAASAGSP